VSLRGPDSDAAPPVPGLPPGLPGSAICHAEVALTPLASTAGLVAGSFIVPETCNTTIVDGGSINAGAQVVVEASGQQSLLDLRTTLTVPPTQVLILPGNGAPANAVSGVFTLIADRFAAGDQVTMQFGTLGSIESGTPLLSVSGIADAAGHVRIPNQAIALSAGSGPYALLARGLDSSVSDSLGVTWPLQPLDGGLTCPAGPVQAGQPFSVSGIGVEGGTRVVGSASFPAPQEVSALADAAGAFTLGFTAPSVNGTQSYPLLAIGIVAGDSTQGLQHQLQTRQCMVAVEALSTPTATASSSLAPRLSTRARRSPPRCARARRPTWSSARASPCWPPRFAARPPPTGTASPPSSFHSQWGRPRTPFPWRGC
jgi:hypothetical protein